MTVKAVTLNICDPNSYDPGPLLTEYNYPVFVVAAIILTIVFMLGKRLSVNSSAQLENEEYKSPPFSGWRVNTSLFWKMPLVIISSLILIALLSQ